MGRLILASASPRRRELLEDLGVPFEVIPSHADESLPRGVPLRTGLETIALRKAGEVARRTDGPRWVLGADTAVVVDDRVLGKPSTPEEAEGMLRALSGRDHRVITAVALLGPAPRESFSVETVVAFRPLSDTQIRWYTSLPEPYDKAGGYAIQGRGGFMVASLHGSYTNVVGLPLSETVERLEAAGFVPWQQSGDGRRVVG